MKHNLLLSFLFLLIVRQVQAQFTTDKVTGSRNQEFLDSLENSKYPYVLPIWGQKAVAKGFKLQNPAGFSLNYLWQKSDLHINNLQVGFNNGELYNLDDIIRFNEATSETNGINFRPDFWLFPFLNIYGIFAMSSSATSINASLWLPDDSV